MMKENSVDTKWIVRGKRCTRENIVYTGKEVVKVFQMNCKLKQNEIKMR